MDVIYNAKLQLVVKDEQAKAKEETSAYLERFKDNLIKSAQKDAWKYTGQSAQFQGQYSKTLDMSCKLTINSVAAFDSNSYIYSATATGQGDTVSAIIKKEYFKGDEQYIYHGNKERFYAIEFDGENRIAASVEGEGKTARNIAVYKIATNDLVNLTDGDTIDDNPSFSKTDAKIFFDTRSIGRDENMQAVAYSEGVICAITENNELEDIAAEKGFDLLMPKNDSEGNLYFIKKPHKNKRTGKSVWRTLLDAILFPYWLIYGIVKILVVLTNLAKKSNKKVQNVTDGANPSMETIKSERELYLQNELIDLEREEKRNKKAGDKNPGYAPKSFELWKRSPEGEQNIAVRGLLSYDITKDNKIIYNNGKYIILKDREREEVIINGSIINNIAAKVDKTTHKACIPADPFGE